MSSRRESLHAQYIGLVVAAFCALTCSIFPVLVCACMGFPLWPGLIAAAVPIFCTARLIAAAGDKLIRMWRTPLTEPSAVAQVLTIVPDLPTIVPDITDTGVA